MREIVWSVKSDRPEQRVAFIAIIIYLLTIIEDSLLISMPIIFFGLNIIAVGIGFIICSYKNKYKACYLIIGILWIFIGLITRVDLAYTISGIPIAILGSSFGYFFVLIAIAYTVILRRKEYLNTMSYIFCSSLAIIMAIINLISFFGLCTVMNYYSFSDSLIPIGEAVLIISKVSLLEFISMLVAVLFIILQKPIILNYYHDYDE